jgi:hypothetical protein
VAFSPRRSRPAASHTLLPCDSSRPPSNMSKQGVFEMRVGTDSSSLSEGTSHDAVDMRRLGKKQELKVRLSHAETKGHSQELTDRPQRNFHSISILGLTCTIMCTWMGILSYVVATKAASRCLQDTDACKAPAFSP